MYLDGRRKEIIAWVAQGLNDREIAERCRVSPSTVRYWRERNGVIKPAKTEDLPSQRQENTKGNSSPEPEI